MRSTPSLDMIENPGSRGPEEAALTGVVFLTTLLALLRLAGLEMLALDSLALEETPRPAALERDSSNDNSLLEKLENSSAGEAS